MATQRQIEANRRNARKSTGPRTAAGRARSRMNALKHGLSRKLPPAQAPDPRILPLARAIAGEAVTDPHALATAEEVAALSLTLVTLRALRRSLLGADAGAGERRSEAREEPALALTWTRLDRFERQALTGRRHALARLDAALHPLQRSDDHGKPIIDSTESDKTKPNLDP